MSRRKRGLRGHYLVSQVVNSQDVSSSKKIFPDDVCIPSRELTQVLCCNSYDYGPSCDSNLLVKVTLLV